MITPELEALRQRLMTHIDALLARPFLVWGEDRVLLNGVRGYAVNMSEDDLTRLNSYMIHHQPLPPHQIIKEETK